MDPGVLSTISALTGTAIGALSSLGTTWMSTTAQARVARLTAEREKREALYGSFMDQLARLYTSAVNRIGVDIELLTDAYATHGRIALYSSEPVNNAAAHALRQIVTLSMGPVLSDAEVRQMMEQPDADLIGIFARACREELTALR